MLTAYRQYIATYRLHLFYQHFVTMEILISFLNLFFHF